MNRIVSIISLFFIPYFAFAKGVNFSLDGVTIPKSVNFIYLCRGLCLSGSDHRTQWLWSGIGG